MNVIIHYYSTIDEMDGYGEAARGYIKALDKYIDENGITNFAVIPYQPLSFGPIVNNDIASILFRNMDKASGWNSDVVDVLIAHIQPVVSSNNEPNLSSLLKKTCILIYNTVFECSDIPKHFVQAIENATAIIVPSELSLSAFKLHHDKVICIPHYIEEFTSDELNNRHDIRFDSGEGKDAFTNPKGMRILTVLSQNTDRKGLDVLLSAYISEFNRSKDDVELLIKASCKGYKDVDRLNNTVEYMRSAFMWKNKEMPYINVIPNIVDRDTMGTIYGSSQLTAMLSRGEGFCLPLAESLMNEVPVLYTAWGGHTDYLMDRNVYPAKREDLGFGYPVYYMLDTVISNTYPFDMTHAKWAIPNILAARRAMREAYSDWKSGILTSKGKKGRQFILDNIGYSNIGKAIVDLVQSEVCKLY